MALPFGMRDVLGQIAGLDAVQGAIAEGLLRVVSVFDEQLESDLPAVSSLCRHVEQYRGKMLRPTLVLLCGMAAHVDAARSDADGWTAQRWLELITSEHIVCGAVCEMVHMATLVHDDVLDEADTRRRARTVNKLHGNEPAVMLGDYLIANAYHLCSSLDSQAAARTVARASVVTCAGELLQLHHREDFSLDEATYFEIVARKTAELIAASCSLGASASGCTPDQAALVADFGRRVGIAFQIQDDILDLTGEERVVGKSVGKDIQKGKLTLPLIHYLSHASPTGRGAALRLLEQACSEDADAADARRELAAVLQAGGSLSYARSRAAGFIAEAQQRLDQLAPSAARRVLTALSDAVLSRDH